MVTLPNRRLFLKSSAIAGIAIGLPAFHYSRVFGANSRLGIASIGTGGKGWSDLKERMAGGHPSNIVPAYHGRARRMGVP